MGHRYRQRLRRIALTALLKGSRIYHIDQYYTVHQTLYMSPVHTYTRVINYATT